ncbi:uncharacterized protein MKZ38_008311 [Zalerion maritima]|uniref:Uncharacterized protein n=1 Tax=Zalerion maritima TaxID=339359 RepID=A0AAD5RL15_9PEZI|nr:uncharacterized protein MKZ38_008311 [Zalerion maritima]
MTPRLDHFNRFRRHKKETSPASVASSADSSTELKRPTTAPAPAIPHSSLESIPPVPTNPQQLQMQAQTQAGRQKSPLPSVFRQLKARATAKRARSPAIPQAPLTAVVSHETAAEHHPLSRSGTPATSQSMMDISLSPHRSCALKMPSFLEISDNDIDLKFQDITWRERTRLQSSAMDPSPSHVWAKCSPRTYPQYLDRYSNISPWNNNRVRLRVPPGKVSYINASPIELQSPSIPSRVDKFIAMQGPTIKSWPHVWRMVTEQLDSPAVIVMLTETHENSGMEKCWPYFPREPDSPIMQIEDEFGDGYKASVRCAEIIPTPAGNSIELRKLIIKVESLGNPDGEVRSRQSESDQEVDDMENNGGVPYNPNRLSASSSSTDFASESAPSPRNSPSTSSLRPRPSPSPVPSIAVEISYRQQNQPPKVDDERVVYHFLYKKWPDFGVPQTSDLDSFLTLMRLSREYNSGDDNPRIVHCSAGVGRSGTFITLDHIIKELEAGYLENYDESWAGRLSAPGSNRSSFVDADDAETGSSTSVPHSGGAPINSSAGLAPPTGPSAGNQMTSQLAAAEAVTKPPPSNGLPPDLIFETVDALRRQRKTMVQAESQYLFIYEVMRMLWRDRYARAEGEPASKRLEADPFVAE